MRDEKLVEAHGSFSGPGKCGMCDATCPAADLKSAILNGKKTGYEGLKCMECNDGHYKPPIVFFGEDLPHKFKANYKADMEGCDLCIVMGTSLSVAPFSGLPALVPDDVPRLLINREVVGDFYIPPSPVEVLQYASNDGGINEKDRNYRDVVALGDCDRKIEEMCMLLGWQAELGGDEKDKKDEKEEEEEEEEKAKKATLKVKRVSSAITLDKARGRKSLVGGAKKRVSVDESRNVVQAVPSTF